MLENNYLKEYEAPKFECVRQDESNKVFFAASGSAPATTASIANVTGSGITSW